MPTSSLIKLAKETPNPGEIIMLFNTTRCGSTLACQMFSKLPNTKVMSEPWPLLTANADFIHGSMTDELYEEVIEASVKVQCKQDVNKDIHRILYKPPGAAMPVAHIGQFSYHFVVQKLTARWRRKVCFDSERTLTRISVTLKTGEKRVS